MTGVAVIAQLKAANKESRKTIIEAIEKVSQLAKREEPGTIRHAICVPRDDSDDNTIWVIEGYTSQAAFDAHMASQPVKDVMAFLGANPTLFGGEGNFTTSEESSAFARPEVALATDPWITYASIEYKDGSRAEALEGWKKVTSETEKNEPETLSYGIFKNREHQETVKTIEVYASLEYFKTVHVPSKAVQENKEKYGDEVRVSLQHAFLKFVGGFLSK